MINIINKMKSNKHNIRLEIEEKENHVFFIIYIDDSPIIKIEEL
jgi:hypothetical protein